MSKKNPNRIIIAHLNINSIRNKSEMLKEVVGNKIDVLLISETKLDNTFPLNQFILEDLLHHTGLIERRTVEA